MTLTFTLDGGGALTGPVAGPVTGPVTAATATPTVSPTPFGTTNDKQPDPSSVSPGLLGFLVIFALAVVVWLLLRNMTGHLRRMRFREEQARREAEARESEAHDGEPDAGRGPTS